MPTISPAQLAANRANSQLSTGPRTAEGKAKSSLNAVRTGLTGRAILLSAAEGDAYELHVARFACDLNPIGDREAELVQSLADTQWRLNRIPILEAGIYAARRLEYADLFLEEADENIRALLLQTYIWETNRRIFNNLSLQESRLRRNYAKDLAELQSLQQRRKDEEQPSAPSQVQGTKPLATKPMSQAIGFESSEEPTELPAMENVAPIELPDSALRAA